MLKPGKSLVLFVVFIFLNACTGIKYASFTSLESPSYEDDSERVDLYFSNSQPYRNYRETGFVEVVGDESTTYRVLIANLQYKAYLNGANAVMNINRSFKTNIEFDDSDIDDSDINTSQLITGIAIVYTDSVQYRRNDIASPSFMNIINEQKKQETTKITVAIILSALVAIGIISALNDAEQQHKKMLGEMN